MVSQVGLNNSYSTMLCCNPYLKDIETILETGKQPESAFGQNTLNSDTFSFSGTAKDPNDITNCLVEKDTNTQPTADGSNYKKTNTGKILGGIVGTAAPIVTRLITKTGFKFKPVAIACSALGIAGAGIGALVDCFTNSKRAEAAENTAQTQTA